MSRRAAGMVAVVGTAVLCLSLVTAGVSGKSKIRRVGTSTQVETASHGKKNIVVTGLLQSPVPKCERDRSVLLYEVGPSGNFAGAAIGHGISQGGAARGQVEISGETIKKISPSRRFRMEAVGRKVIVKGRSVICKRGVSASFLGTFG